MHELLVVGGALVVLLTFVDAFATTLAVSRGAGPMTRSVLAVLWRAALRVHRRDREGGWLVAGGPVLLVTTVALWVGALWTGWTLVFHGSQAVVTSTGARPAGLADVVYFTGFTVFTLGTGDFVAATPGWRVVMAVAAFSGLFLVTLAITYLISVVAALVARRVVAVQVHGLGDSPAEIVARGWTGEGFGSMFQQQLVSLSTAVTTSAEQHLAYPVLHYFHSGTRGLAAPVAVAHLDDALTTMTAMAPEHRPEASAVDPLRSAVERYLATAAGTARMPDVEAPAPPSTDGLREAGVPVDDDAVREVAERDRERRACLVRLVVSDGWAWHG